MAMNTRRHAHPTASLRLTEADILGQLPGLGYCQVPPLVPPVAETRATWLERLYRLPVTRS